MAFPDFGKKNKGGKKDLPTDISKGVGKKAKAIAKKNLRRKKPTQY